jgi:hypothetical protein
MRRETQPRLDSFVAPPQPTPIEQKLLSTGQRLVGLGMSEDSEVVDEIKRRFAEIADFLIDLESKKEFVNEHHKLLHNEALMQIVSAAQFTTKSITYKILD